MNSFAENIKKELSELNNLANKNLVKAELSGYLLTTSSNEFTTESQYNINRFGKLLSNIGENDYSIRIKGKKYTIKPKRKIETKYETDGEEQIKALVRGAFLGTGTITNPQNIYHLEIIFDKKENADIIKEIFDKYSINSNIIQRKNKYLIYIEEGNSISGFLAFIGANKSVLEFENTRVIKEVRNKVNRLVNCETANLNKTIDTAVRQIEDIKLIKASKKFKDLSEKEQELAELRLKNTNASLAELGEKSNPKISKSGVSHRMANIAKLAEEIRNNKK